MKSNPELMFSKNSLNRMDCMRQTIDDFFTLHPTPPARFILISGEDLALREHEMDYLFTLEEITSLGISHEGLIFLGIKESIYYFVKSIDQTILNKHFKHTENLRSFAIANIHTDRDIGLLAQAFSMTKWHESHRFCPACGRATSFAHGGWRQDCLSCGKEHFPRIDPVVIMLVTCGDYCLLGSGRQFPEKRYSCLAGFIEPGETIEDAARRELFEEAGVIGREVNYIASQPWPFPFSLMIGVRVIAEEMTLDVNYIELVDAKWVHKSEVAAVLNGATEPGFTLPPRIAIARVLLEDWVALS